MAIVIPNLEIKVILDQLVSIIRLDYSTHKTVGTLSESWLYRVFNGVKFGSFDYYIQAIEILCTRDDNSPRKLNIRNGFSLVDKPNTPTIHINVPSEKEDGVNTIGMGLDSGGYYENADGTETPQYFRTFGGHYELMITSPNVDEVELLYRFLQALFISANDTLCDIFDGIFKFDGKQIIANNELMPTPMFIKVWDIYVQHRVVVPRLAISETMLNAVEFEGHFYPVLYGSGAIGEAEL
jgi:hypothetical protein